MKVLLLGSKGQLGHQLTAEISPVFNLIDFSRKKLDITDHKKVNETISEIDPDIIINAAAYTNVEEAEMQQELAYAINARAVKNIAEISNRLNKWLVHFSTDYVFDGVKHFAYSEKDHPNPVNIYGASKLAGEISITNSNCKHLIFRTSWVIGAHGKNFARTILKLAQKQSSLNVINDQFGVPTSTDLIARVTIDAIKSIENNHSWPIGLYNLAPKGSTNWHEVAKQILEIADWQGLILAATSENLNPIKSSEMKQKAKRPKNSQLKLDKLASKLSFELPDWQTDLHQVTKKIINELSTI